MKDQKALITQLEFFPLLYMRMLMMKKWKKVRWDFSSFITLMKTFDGPSQDGDHQSQQAI